MQRLSIKTRKHREVLDITDLVEEYIESSAAEDGVCNLLVLHTTAALTTADLDPGTDLDLLDAYEAMVPKLCYRHPRCQSCAIAIRTTPRTLAITLCRR